MWVERMKESILIINYEILIERWLIKESLCILLKTTQKEFYINWISYQDRTSLPIKTEIKWELKEKLYWWKYSHDFWLSKEDHLFRRECQ